jgi:phosphatidylethanolamine/phosphatidyl-N-methylethanolamine N-methyltransferase
VTDIAQNVRLAASSAALFASQTIRTFHSTGAICPSSRFLARAMAWPVSQLNTAGPIRVLEVGPGTGSFTREIVKHLRPPDRLDLVELSPRFAEHMRQWARTLPHESPVIQVHETPIQDFGPDYQYDAIVSGLPFNNFPPALVDSILGRLVELGRPGAKVSFFQYIAIRNLKGAFIGADGRRNLREVGEAINRWIEGSGSGTRHVWLNVPPASAHFLRVE